MNTSTLYAILDRHMPDTGLCKALKRKNRQRKDLIVIEVMREYKGAGYEVPESYIDNNIILDEALLGGIKTTDNEPKAETGQVPDAGQGAE